MSQRQKSDRKPSSDTKYVLVYRGFKMSRCNSILISGLLSVLVVMCVVVAVVTSLPQSERRRSAEQPTFTAAVYEHIPFMPDVGDRIYTRREAVDLMKKNLQIYAEQTKKAKQQGSQIIGFPEDGIYGYRFNRKSILHFLEKIPDPKVTKWSPCSDSTRYADSEVQHAISCMAKENSMYVVANMGDNVPCNASADPKCPPDGHYQYNTDVAFDPEGNLVAKYHKTNLFYESQFDTPKPEVVYFDTPFGRFGMLICFDLLFKEPAVTMVTEHNITNVVFLTAWMDALPLLSAIGYHSSFARGLGVNFLSANLHLPAFKFHGSGIFTPNGMANFYYNNSLNSPGKLLVSTIDVMKTNTKIKEDKKLENKVNAATIANDFNATGDEFQAKLFDDMFTFKALEDTSGSLSVCQRNVCCSLTYSLLDEARQHQDLFAFGVYDGLHTYQGQYYFQICTLVKCANNDDRQSCGSPTKVSNTKFKSLSMTGNFQTKFVYPQMILSKNEQLLLGDEKSWSFHDTTLTSGSDLDDPVLSATLYGRYYCRDDGVSTCNE